MPNAAGSNFTRQASYKSEPSASPQLAYRRSRTELDSSPAIKKVKELSLLPESTMNGTMAPNENLKKEMNHDLFVKSARPWESIRDAEANQSQAKLLKRYVLIFYKILISHSELLCYFWMLASTFMKPGALYMVYPMLIFGYAILEEQKPGRYFWFFVIFYTQLLIIMNFAA